MSSGASGGVNDRPAGSDPAGSDKDILEDFRGKIQVGLCRIALNSFNPRTLLGQVF